MNEELTEKWKEIMRQKWEGANTGGHNAISTPVMEEILSDIENLLEQERRRMSEEIEEMKTYTGGSSVNEKDKRVNKQEVLSIINK